MPIGEPFYELDAIDSTNNYAMAQVQAHLAAHGTAWFAHHQKAGKGQRNKTWISAPGANIILSVAIVPTGVLLQHQFIISAMVALACKDLFNDFTKGDVSIKWPNDIYWRDRKAGGILIENLIQGNQWKFAIVGIGLNINQVQFDDMNGRPVSLRQVTGRNYDVVALSKLLCSNLEQRLLQLRGGDNAGILNEYSKHMFKMGEQVTFKRDSALFTAKISGVSATGELMVEMGGKTSIPIGAVEWVIT